MLVIVDWNVFNSCSRESFYIMGFGINKYKCPNCSQEFYSAWNSVTMEFGTSNCPKCFVRATFAEAFSPTISVQDTDNATIPENFIIKNIKKLFKLFQR